MRTTGASVNDKTTRKSAARMLLAVLLAICGALFLAACAGTSEDPASTAGSSATVAEGGDKAASEESERPFSCPVAEAQIAAITGLELELEKGTDASLGTPAEALAAEPVIDVLLCGFTSPQASGPAMVNIHWTEFSGRMDEYEITEHPEWGEEGFVMQIESSAVAKLRYPGGGYWSVTALAPAEASSGPDTAEWAEGVGNAIADEKAAEPKGETGTTDLGEASLRQHLGKSLSTICPDIDQATTYFEGGGIGASADDATVEGIECDSLVELVHQISPALDDSYWQDRVTSVRLNDVGGISCFVGEASEAEEVPVYCDDAEGTRASFALVHTPEPE